MIDSEEAAQSWLRELPECDVDAMARLELLVDLLVAENARQNLVSADSLASVWRRHVADSAQLLRHVPRGTSPWMDLGTGAGFPGLVLAALRPEMEILLVESRTRRVEWLERARSALGLHSAVIFGMRLESVEARPMRVISARAFAPLDRLVDLSARFSTAETLWLLPKGRSAQQEIASLTDWVHTFHVEQSVTDSQSGVIVGQVLGRKGRRK